MDGKSKITIRTCPVSSEHPSFILYTSGTTGKPKGLLHTTAGYLLGATVTAKYIFDIKILIFIGVLLMLDGLRDTLMLYMVH